MPSAEWVERVFHRKWYGGVRRSPFPRVRGRHDYSLQLARMISGIAWAAFSNTHFEGRSTTL